VQELATSLEELLWVLLEEDDVWQRSSRWMSTDGVVADITRTAPNQFELNGALWFLGGGRDGGSWAEPFRARIALSDDGSSVTQYELMFGDSTLGLGPKVGEAVPPTDGAWLFAFHS
jgi:hypothetical protein